MEDLEGEHLRRDLNEQDDLDNLDLQYDRNNEYLDIEKFNSDLLFAVQGLGSVKQVNEIEIYVKGPHCEESIKDLIRLCRKDDSDEPLARKKLAVWKTFENDLIQLLLTQYQDKKLAFYLILLMVNLTEQPTKTCVIKNELRDALYEYKLSFLKPQVIGTLMQHLGDCIENHQMMLLRKQTTREKGKNETKAHEQMIELIVILIKNILAIRDSPYNDSNHNEIYRNMHFHLLCQMKREHCFDLLIFLSQDFSKFDVLKKLDVIFLEIFYHIFSGFDPEWLCSANGNGSSDFAKLLEKDRLEKKKLNQMIPSRHTRFQANFRFKRMLDDTKKLTTNPFAGDQFDQTKVTKNQLNKPIPRKFLQQQEGIFRKRLHLDLKVDMPLQHNLTQNLTIDQQDDEDTIKSELVTFKSVMLQFSLEFIKYSFCPLFEQCYNLLYTDSEKLEPIDTVYYFVLMGFGLKLTRIVVFEHKASELEIVDIAVALQLTQFQLIFSKLVKEVTHNKKRSFNLKNFYSTVYVFNELLQVIRVMSTDNSQMNRKNSQIMLQNIFHHDITKALRIGVDYCQYNVLNNEVLKNLVELINIFFDLLESYSKGKVLTLQTDKLVKKKKKKVNSKSKKALERQLQSEMNDFIEKDPNEGQEDDEDFNPNKELEIQNVEKKEDAYDEDDDEDSDDDGPQFQERKYNLQSEFAILADYNVILKVLQLIQGDKILTNSPNLNNAVYKFIQRITDLLKADWILYQVDFISIIQEICSNQEIKMRLDCKKFIELFRKIIRNMFEKIKQNKLLLVEMLFRFTDATLKNSILCNYEDLEKNENEFDNILNENEAENADQQTILERKVWIEQEDRAIINNYETFKDLTNVFEQLGLVLNGLGFYDKTPLDIRRRVKYLKLHKGKQRAEKIFKEIYASKKVSIKRAVRELYLKLKDNEENVNNIEINDIQILLDSIFVNFKEYIYFIEEQNTNLTDFERLVQVQDYCIVPYTVKDFDILNLQSAQQLLESLGFRAPAQGQIYWRVPGFFKVSDVDLLKEKVDKFLQNPEILLENNQEEGLEGQDQLSSKKKKSKQKKIKNQGQMQEEESANKQIENEESQENKEIQNVEEDDQDVAFIRDYEEGEQNEAQQESNNILNQNDQEQSQNNNKSTSKKRKLCKVKQNDIKSDDSEMIYMGYDEQSNNENSQQNQNLIQSRKSSFDASKSFMNAEKENSNSFVRQFLNESNNENNKQMDENSMSANSMIFNKYQNKKINNFNSDDQI
ncbi:Yip1 domain protein (macronuclear) [Tetrahymena thermophila SB210]|uniref:Yip1 domain protein n=1 Tax=Tetrahymena thermophila (strain SB210) TaxID=312017 RepID=Q23DS8_TETTS|nr:Yip1 domain protein [Tetrahymena thermophila SB210]EAR94710.2 Yip1 domain protein [Tetrahymena thermophila SB210]|eukprot:XP_001014608.2 Yip1 domain protein [Tetrahymena thermophila SB210]